MTPGQLTPALMLFPLYWADDHVSQILYREELSLDDDLSTLFTSMKVCVCVCVCVYVYTTSQRSEKTLDSMELDYKQL